MTSDEIRLALYKIRKHGGSMAEIAQNVDPPCTRQAVSAVINRTATSRRIAGAVSEVLGFDMRIVFPEYFKKESGKSGEIMEADDDPGEIVRFSKLKKGRPDPRKLRKTK